MAAVSTTDIQERRLRKRLAARLRQQRCRARKREAMLAKKQKQLEKSSSKTPDIGTFNAESTPANRPVLVPKNIQSARMPHSGNIHQTSHYTVYHQESAVGYMSAHNMISSQDMPPQPLCRQRHTYPMPHNIRKYGGPNFMPLRCSPNSPSVTAAQPSLLPPGPLPPPPIDRSAMNGSQHMMQSEELAIDAMLSLRSGGGGSRKPTTTTKTAMNEHTYGIATQDLPARSYEHFSMPLMPVTYV